MYNIYILYTEVIKIKKVIDNLNINYIKKGSGPNVLILPGWGTTINIYNNMIDDLSTYSTVYTLDMPGFGASTEQSIPWDLDDYIDFVIKFIESENITELNVIGHSNGGRILIKMMSRKNLSFKINKVILIGSAGIVRKKKLIRRLKLKVFKFGKKILMLKPFKMLFPNLITTFQNKFGSADYKNASPILKQSMVKLINEDLREYLPNVYAPTLLIWGENDTETPITDAYIMEKEIPNAGLVKIPNGSHYVFLENPQYINKIIHTFLGGK